MKNISFNYKIIKDLRKMEEIIKTMCKRFEQFDVEWVYYLPQSYKNLIVDTISSISDENVQNDNFTNFLFHFSKLNPSLHLSTILSFNLKNIPLTFQPLTTLKPLQRFKPLKLKSYLEKDKNKIDLFHNYEKEREIFYSLASNFFDRFTHYKQSLGKTHRYITYEKEIDRTNVNNRISNAWLKCWEILHTFPIIPRNLNREYKVFCNAEFPGSFIFAINHYIKTKTYLKYDWIASSLWPNGNYNGNDNGNGNKEEEIFGDRYGLYTKYREKWLMDGKNYKGDVTNREMLEYVKKRTNHSIDLYTSDIGIHLSHSTFHLQEELETPLNLGQIIHGLSSLREGGVMICKMFMFFTTFNQSMLYVLNNMFDNFYITKPVTSRPGNSEIYIVGINFKGYQQNLNDILLLEDYLFNWNEDKNNHPIKGKEITPSFYLKLVYASYLIYGRQLLFIEENIDIAKKLWEKYEREIKEDSQKNIYRRIKDVITLDNVLSIPSLKNIYERREREVEEWNQKYPVGFLHFKERL